MCWQSRNAVWGQCHCIKAMERMLKSQVTKDGARRTVAFALTWEVGSCRLRQRRLLAPIGSAEYDLQVVGQYLMQAVW